MSTDIEMARETRADEDAAARLHEDAAAQSATPTCRICLDDEAEEEDGQELLQLHCACVDSFVHASCANKWYGSRGCDVCEVCRERIGIPIDVRAVERRGLAFTMDGIDEADLMLPAADVLVVYTGFFAAVFVSLAAFLHFTVAQSIALAYAASLGVLVGLSMIFLTFRRRFLTRLEMRFFLGVYGFAMFVSHQIAFFLSMKGVRSRPMRLSTAYGLTWTLGLASVCYPLVFMLAFGACIPLRRARFGV
jgi:hypothetical protein